MVDSWDIVTMITAHWGGRTTYFLDDAKTIPHRPNGPARIYTDDDWEWYLFGNLHRYYGPPTCFGGSNDWYDIWTIHGKVP